MTPTLKTTQLDDAVEQYRVAIATLEAAGEKLSVEDILQVLLARDAVQAAITDKTQVNRRNLIKTVKKLDQRLKQQAESVNRVVSQDDLKAILTPPEKDWWFLLEPPIPWSDRYDGLWSSLSFVFLTASLSLLLPMSSRFLSSGPDLLGASAIAIQSVLTLLTGGTLTKPGRQGMEYLFKNWKVPKRYWDELSCGLSFSVLQIVLGLWIALPQIAVGYYKTWGDEAYRNRLFNRAEHNYSRAIALDPDNAEAHYKLGKIYEEQYETDKAIGSYREAVKRKGSFPQAADDIANLYFQRGDYPQANKWLWQGLQTQNSNNQKHTLNDKQYTVLQQLVRVYLEQKKDNNEAYRFLVEGLKKTGDDTTKQYTLLAYFGWLRLNQERFPDAEKLLLSAIKLDKNRATAHCLLAQVLDKQENTQRANLEWEQCRQYASLDNLDEDYWAGLADKRNKGK